VDWQKEVPDRADSAALIIARYLAKEQVAIEALETEISDMDAELTALEQRRDKTRALKHGMMQELLTGRNRLVRLGTAA
jgi:type I restriction enzyme S subunit